MNFPSNDSEYIMLKRKLRAIMSEPDVKDSIKLQRIWWLIKE